MDNQEILAYSILKALNFITDKEHINVVLEVLENYQGRNIKRLAMKHFKQI